MIKKPDDPNSNAHRVITFLTREELDFLDKLGKDALFSAGSKLSRSKIISAMVNAIRKLNIDACGLNSKKQLELRIMQAMRKMNRNENQAKPKTEDENKVKKGDQDGKYI